MADIFLWNDNDYVWNPGSFRDDDTVVRRERAQYNSRSRQGRRSTLRRRQFGTFQSKINFHLKKKKFQKMLKNLALNSKIFQFQST